jgi:hypothetical protein
MATATAPRPQTRRQAAPKAAKTIVSIKKTDDESPYNAEFVAKIKRGDEAIKAGAGRKITLEEMRAAWR